MIKFSYLNSELIELKKNFGAENVILSKDNSFVELKNFVPPKFFESNKSSLIFEIPDGFGYGVNVSNVYVYLKEKFARDHLYLHELNYEKIFGKKKTLLPFSDKQWFWICFHLFGEVPEIDFDFNPVQKKRSNILVGFMEYVSLMKIVLEAIAKGDSEVLENLMEMNNNREELIENQKRYERSFVSHNNWRNIKWMY